MKKSIFILAALWAATIANAQITLEATYPNSYLFGSNYSSLSSTFTIYGDIFFEYNANGYKLIDAYSLDEITTLPTTSSWFVAAQGYFSNADEVIIVTDYNNHIALLSETGSVIQDLGEIPLSDPSYYQCYPEIKRLSDNSCKLILTFYAGSNGVLSQVYSIPGNGVATEISTPSSPKRSAQKIARDGQVLVETETNTYTLQGSEVH